MGVDLSRLNVLDVKEFAAPFNRIMDDLNQYFVERETETRLAMLAILSRKHCLFVGPPGTAKSQLISSLCKHFGLKYFEICLNRYTTPEELFGMIDPRGMDYGEYIRKSEYRLPWAEIAFLDEIFKTNESIRDTLLKIINERIFYSPVVEFTDNGMKVVQPWQRVPLISMFAASNELPEEDESVAMYDRIHIRKVVERIKDDRNFEKILRMENIAELLDSELTNNPTPLDLYKARKTYDREYVPKTKVDRKTLNKAILLADCVDISKIISLITQVRRKLADDGIKPTDRRMKEALAIIKANAFLSGRMVADSSDLSVLQHILWDRPDQQETVRSVVLELVDPYAKKIEEYKVVLADYEEMAKNKLDAMKVQEIITKLKIFENEMNELRKDAVSEGKDTSELEEITQRIADLKMTLIDRLAGI